MDVASLEGRQFKFAPNGASIASALKQNKFPQMTSGVQLWSLNALSRITIASRIEPDPKRLTNELFWSTDGQLAATIGEGGPDAVLTIWDVANVNSPARLTEFSVPQGAGRAMAFSNDNRRIATLGKNAVDIWDISNLRAPNKISSFALSGVQITQLRFTSNGQSIIGVAYDDSTTTSIWRWETDADRASQTVCSKPDVSITHDDWKRYFFDIPQRSSCEPA